MRYKKKLKKIFNPKFVLKSSSYQYFHFKNEFPRLKNGKIDVFIVKILQGEELLLKTWMWEMKKWLCSPQNPPSGQKFKMLYLVNW